MDVEDIMTASPPALTPESSVTEAARMLLDRRTGGAPVVDQAGRLVGVVTEKDLVSKHAHVHLPVYIGFLGAVAEFQRPGGNEEIRHALAVKVADLMESEPITLQAGASVEDAASLMVEHDVAIVPVLENHTLIGTVTAADIIRLVLVEEEDAGGTG